MSNQVQTGYSTVNGNYGFGTVWRLNPDGTPVLDADGNKVEDTMPAGDYWSRWYPRTTRSAPRSTR